MSESTTNNSSKKKRQWVAGGSLLTLLWIYLLLTGMLVNSSYYRAAISFGYAELADWIWALLSFTLSNVAILAFLAGLLGGIISKMRSTEGFTVSEEELKKTNKSKYLWENPFISAVRGVILFVAVLALQYVSSFTDIGNIQTPESALPKTLVTYDSSFYLQLKAAIRDTSSLDSITSIWNRSKSLPSGDPNDIYVRIIFALRDSCKMLKKDHQDQYLSIKRQIRDYRRQVKLPATDNIPGMSLMSYFKFAMIISLLAFICGYDPSIFNELLRKWGINEKNGS